MTPASIQAKIAERFTPVLVTDEPDWIDAPTVLSEAQPSHVDAMLAVQRGGSRGHTDAAAGSLLLLEYARLLAWPVLAARLLDGSTLDPSPSNVALRADGLERGGLAFRRGPMASPTQADVSPDSGTLAGREALFDDVVGVVDHLKQLGVAIDRRARIGRRTVLGDVASALAGGLLALSWMDPPRDRYLGLASSVIESHPDLRGLISLSAIQHENQPWMVVWRRACCLAFGENESRSYCGTCPILDEYERIERFHYTANRYLALTEEPADTTGR